MVNIFLFIIMGSPLVIQFSMDEWKIGNLLLGTDFKNCFAYNKKLKMGENIMNKYNFSPVLYMTMLKIFNGD